MITIRTRIEGSEPLEQMLRRGMRFKPVMHEALRAGAVEIAGRISQYPPTPPNQVYARTGNLGRSWVRPPIAQGMNRWMFGNSMSYAERVMGRRQLEFFGQRGWKTIDRHIEENAPRVVAKVTAAVLRELR